MKRLIIATLTAGISFTAVTPTLSHGLHGRFGHGPHGGEVINNRTYGFTLINNSNSEVCIAKARFNPYSSRPSVTYSHYYASGWFCIAPFSSKTLFKSRVGGADDVLRLHISKGGQTLIPKKTRGGVRYLCINNGKFSSVNHKSARESNYLRINNTRMYFGGNLSYKNKTCASVGGRKAPFYGFKRYFEYTVN